MTWTAADLDRTGLAEELELASRNVDGTVRPSVTMWAARVGDELFVRSAHGPNNGWYRRAVAIRTGRIRSGGVDHDVTCDDAVAATIRLLPASAAG